MISYESITIYITGNTIFLSLGYIQYKSVLYLKYSNILLDFCILYIIYIIRSYFLINFVDFISRKKIKINNTPSKIPIESYKYEFHRYVLFNTLIESTIHFFTIEKIINIEKVSNIYFDLIYFIPISFLYEIIYDFFFILFIDYFMIKNYIN